MEPLETTIQSAHSLAGAIESIHCSMHENAPGGPMLMIKWTCMDGQNYSHGYSMQEDRRYYDDLIWTRPMTESDLSMANTIEHRQFAQPVITVYWRYLNGKDLHAFMLVHSILGTDYGLRKGEDDKRSFSQRYFPDEIRPGIFELPIAHHDRLDRFGWLR